MDRVSVQEAYEKWSPELVRFATVLVGPVDAADVVADAFVALLADDAGWVRAERPRAYLFGVVANRARMHQRSLFRRRRRDETAARREMHLVPATDEATSTEATSTDVLGVLSAQQRALVYLAYWEDWSIAEIAERMSVSDGTVRRQLARARHKLRKELA